MEDGKIIIECEIPAWSSDFYNEDGTIKDISEIPELRDFIIYRIPTSQMHSIMHVRVKRLLPREYRNILLLFFVLVRWLVFLYCFVVWSLFY